MTADFSLTGQVALVTGASSGLGRAFAGFLADAGAKVVLGARRADKCAEAAAEIGDNAFPVTLDVTDPASIESALDAAENAFGPINTLINNAGTVTNRALVDTPPEEWRQVIDTNLTGCFLVTQAVARRMIAAETGGRIVKRVPQRRFGQIADLEGVLLLLTSPAGGYMTGEIVTIDGGLSLSGM